MYRDIDNNVSIERERDRDREREREREKKKTHTHTRTQTRAHTHTTCMRGLSDVIGMIVLSPRDSFYCNINLRNY